MNWNLSAQQIAVLFILSGGDMPGRELREQLRKHGIKKDGPRFYMHMSRLADSGLVRFIDSSKVSGGHRVHYRPVVSEQPPFPASASRRPPT